MSFPSDVSLSSSKYFGFVDSKYAYNINWDVVWSFSYSLSGNQHGICTFLTTNPTLTTGIPGQYMGYYGNPPLSSGILAIVFDSTGYFALSNTSVGGIPMSSTIPDSLIVRDSKNSVIFNRSLSSLDTSFVLASSVKEYKTLRFRYSNGGKNLYIDYHKDGQPFDNLATIAISTLGITDNMTVYPGFTFCSPISSISITPSTLYLQNFHSQGNISPPSYETLGFTPLSSSITTFTTISTLVSSL